MKKPTFGSLFAGIGGLDLGLERAGWECRWQVEIDDFCQKVLSKHWTNVPKFRDIKTLKGDDLEPVDLICGGFPCQPFSVAGKQRGAADDRYLWPEMLRIIEAVRPTWCLLENVPGIIRMALDSVLTDLEALNYSCRTFVIPACAVNAQHRRDRVWVVGYPSSVRRREMPDESRDNGLFSETRERGVQQLGRAAKPTLADTNTGLSLNQDEEIQAGGNTINSNGWWDAEPDVGRVAHGVPSRVDRLKSLGNAVVPQLAEVIGRMILEAWSKC